MSDKPTPRPEPDSEPEAVVPEEDRGGTHKVDEEAQRRGADERRKGGYA